MLKQIAEPRREVSKYAPKIVNTTIKVDKIKDVIGPGGKMINKIIDKITNKICNFKTIILFIVLIAYIYSMIIIFLSDRGIGLKIIGSAVDTFLILFTYMAIHMI